MQLITGAVASRLIVTELDAVPPALVAVQVNVWPAVSVVMLLVPHPDWDVIVESGSLTVQLTETLLVYHPLFPSVPTTFGVITGGVVSVAAVYLSVICCVGPWPGTQIGLLEFGAEGTLPPLHDVKVNPLTDAAVSVSDCDAEAPPGIDTPFPWSSAVIEPELTVAPVQFVEPRKTQLTGADETPDVLILTLPSVKVVVAIAPDAPTA